jgi:hypothetical protein
MARPSPGSRKKVTPESLAGLGAEKLAEILAAVAETRPDLKRRLRMELAAGQGAGPLAAEIDKRLAAFETSRGKVTWRQAPAFLRDIDALRLLIAERLAAHDTAAAADRLWRLMASARQLGLRYRQRDAELDDIFRRAAADLGALLAPQPTGPAVHDLVQALQANPSGWSRWLPDLLTAAGADFAAEALRQMPARIGPAPGWITLIRHLADAAGDAAAYAATWTPEALKTPSVAAQVAERYLAAGQVEDAGETLRAAAPASQRRRTVTPDVDWESAWIAYLETAGRGAEAQEVRWAAFERTLAADRLREVIRRLPDFEDVEAEQRAFAVAAGFPDAGAALRFLMEWPALAEAARLIEARGGEIDAGPEAAELWAAKLRRRHPKAAHLLLRRAAAAAFRRRVFKTCERLTAEAEAISA